MPASPSLREQRYKTMHILTVSVLKLFPCIALCILTVHDLFQHYCTHVQGVIGKLTIEKNIIVIYS